MPYLDVVFLLTVLWACVLDWEVKSSFSGTIKDSDVGISGIVGAVPYREILNSFLKFYN
jgi:hypothetical protein